MEKRRAFVGGQLAILRRREVAQFCQLAPEAVKDFMNIMVAGIVGGWEVVMILAAFLILFGAKKVPELMGGLGKGIKEFKKATREVTDELNSAMDDPPPAPKKLPAATVSQEEAAAVSQSSSGPKA